MYYYCDCTQDDKARIKSSYNSFKGLKETVVDSEGFCIYCDHVAPCLRKKPGKHVYSALFGITESQHEELKQETLDRRDREYSQTYSVNYEGISL